MTTKKKKTTSGSDLSLFFSVFAGELVEFMTTQMSTITTQTDEGTETGEYPWAIKGYLLDEDENFYYIGRSPTEVTSGIKKDVVIAVAIIDVFEEQMTEAVKNTKDIGDLN
jgi:hypothetical protein